MAAKPVGPAGKSPIVAVILCALPGGGQFYNGDVRKGAVMLVTGVALGIASSGVLWLPVVIWSAIDAYRVASGAGRIW